jgi:hypothetical protein
VGGAAAPGNDAAAAGDRREGSELARTEGMIDRPAAKHPYSKYVTNGASHFETLAATKVVTDWVNGLPR